MVSICRLCASLKKTENLTFIRDNNHELCQKLIKCCQLSIDLKDVLPKGVCPDCIRCLNVSFEFYEKVHESQHSLQKLLNVEPSQKTDDPPASNNDTVISEERDALALMAAAASTGSEETTQEEAPSLQEVHDTSTGNENENSNDTKDDFTEIICVKDEKSTYLILNADATEAAKRDDITEESVIEEGPVNTFFSPTGYGIEFIDEDVEEIDFENQYQIIEEFEDEEGSVQEHAVQYIPQQTGEEKVSIEEPNDGTHKIDADLAINSWQDYPWKCVHCGEVFSSAKGLIEHNEFVHQLRLWDVKWVCTDCLKDFNRYYALVNHVRQRHRSNLALICDVCNEPQQDFKCLEEHRLQKHKDDELLVMLMCPTCGKGFHTSNSLQIHSKCHLPDDIRLRYSCNLCDKKFRTISNLKFHKKMHTGARDFICDQCGKNFAQRANLEEHLVTHLTYTPYECSLCHQLLQASDADGPEGDDPSKRIKNNKFRYCT